MYLYAAICIQWCRGVLGLLCLDCFNFQNNEKMTTEPAVRFVICRITYNRTTIGFMLKWSYYPNVKTDGQR